MSRLDEAHRASHAGACMRMPAVRSTPCFLCPPAEVIQAALDHLDQHPGDISGARLVLHDRVCHRRADCPSRDGHASATQTRRAAALHRFRKREERGTP